MICHHDITNCIIDLYNEPLKTSLFFSNSSPAQLFLKLFLTFQLSWEDVLGTRLLFNPSIMDTSLEELFLKKGEKIAKRLKNKMLS